MAAPAIAATSSLTVVAVGAVANLVANNKPLQAKTWSPLGGFIGLANGRKIPSSSTVVAAPGVPAVAAPKKTNVPIGGQTDEPAPPTPFGRFPKCKPTKLPGPPEPYDPAKWP